MTNLVALFFFVYLLIGIRTTLLVDSLIRWLYENDFDTWELIGKPRGMFFKPVKSAYTSYVLLSFQFCFQKPYWITDSPFTEAIYAKLNFWQKIGLLLSVLMLPVITIGLMNP